MSNLAKPTNTLWGEDVHAQLAHRRSTGEDCDDLRARVLASYMLAVRKRIQAGETAEMVVASSPGIEVHEPLCRMLSDLAHPGTEDLLDEAVAEVLKELDELRKLPPSAYLVDTRTGKAVSPLREELVFTPPDYVGEDGMVHKARPVVHPKLAVSLAMSAAQAERQAKIEALAADPVSGLAYRHLTEPERIADMARERLGRAGVRIRSEEPQDWEESVIEFGKESSEADFQSVNPRFHRSNMYAGILAQRVISLCGPGGSAWVGKVRMDRSSRYRWFSVAVRTASA